MREFFTESFGDKPAGAGKRVRIYLLTGCAVTLFQNSKKRGSFTVQYGRQVHTDCTYAEAAVKLGQALMHAAACEGELDNERD
jgi:hypothetical protein